MGSIGHRGRRWCIAAAWQAAGLLALGASLAIAMAPSPTVGAADPAPTPAAGIALDWLSSELSTNGGTIPGFVPGTSEWGVTADAVLAFVAAGRASDPAAITATDLLTAHVAEFTTLTPDEPDVRIAGATAKTVLVLAGMARSAAAGGVDLEAELRSLMSTTGEEAGRFVDRVPDPTWDSSNGFGQSLAILALASTPEGVPEAAVSYLLAQQCPGGGIRLLQTVTPGCAGDDQADTDATGLAVQALLAVEPRTPGVAQALDRAVAWLLSKQDPGTGAFGGTGPTVALNTNSTGLIAQALRAAGSVEAADRAAAWITATSQLDASNTEGSPAAPAVGAIAYDPAARVDAISNGIDDQGADQWRRTTTQAVLALGLAPYGPQQVDPIPPQTVPTSTTILTGGASTTTSTPTPTTSVSPVGPTTSALPTSAAVGVASSTNRGPAVVEAGELSAESGTVSNAPSSTGRLAFSGRTITPSLLVATAAIVLGLVALSIGTRGRSRW